MLDRLKDLFSSGSERARPARARDNQSNGETKVKHDWSVGTALCRIIEPAVQVRADEYSAHLAVEFCLQSRGGAEWNHHQRPAELLGRIAIMQDTTLADFSSTLSGRDLGARRLRNSALGAAKAVLGNTLYEKLRVALLG